MQNPKELRAWNTVYNKEVTADRTIHKQLARRLLEVADEVEGEPPPLTHSCRRCHALPSLALGAAQTSHAIPRPHPSKCSRGEPSTYPRPTHPPRALASAS